MRKRPCQGSAPFRALPSPRAAVLGFHASTPLLEDEKAALYRALRELEFDHDAGHLSDPDFQSLRERYESRAGVLITELDLFGPVERGRQVIGDESPRRGERGGHVEAPAYRWTRHPATFAAGAAVLVIFGVIIGVNAGRFTERDETFTPPGARIPVPGPPPSPVGPPTVRLEPGKPIPPEMLAGMLQAARQSLFEGRYSEAIAAYQAVLKRDPNNVDAMTHMGLIAAIAAQGEHGAEMVNRALDLFDRALALDPNYPPALLYRGQVLYEVRKDVPGAIKAWEKFVKVAPPGEDRERVVKMLADARAQAGGKR